MYQGLNLLCNGAVVGISHFTRVSTLKGGQIFVTSSVKEAKV
jgi:hypothetical protein